MPLDHALSRGEKEGLGVSAPDVGDGEDRVGAAGPVILRNFFGQLGLALVGEFPGAAIEEKFNVVTLFAEFNALLKLGTAVVVSGDAIEVPERQSGEFGTAMGIEAGELAVSMPTGEIEPMLTAEGLDHGVEECVGFFAVGIGGEVLSMQGSAKRQSEAEQEE